MDLFQRYSMYRPSFEQNFGWEPVCPNLQDLLITLLDPCRVLEGHEAREYRLFSLQGGLCLVSRLKQLNRLRVDYKTMAGAGVTNLNWLCKSG
ncbi:MAG: hypothetical protein J3R72DRAFT_487467 [Linnemannia gamsii]|nr:MAG: hypothetical protein J3R72DRAFT_487467 [Linnemannia gamsii]